MAESTLSVLQQDPLFKAKLNEMQDDLDDRFLDERANAMQVLETGAIGSAQVVIEAATLGKIGEAKVGVTNQLKSAWDVLDRTGNKAVDKRLIGTFDAAELVKEAYARKYRGGNGDEVKSEKKSESKDLVVIDKVIEGKVVEDSGRQMNLFGDL